MLPASLMKAIKSLKAVVIYHNSDTSQPTQTTPPVMASKPQDKVAELLFREDKPDLSLTPKPPAKRPAEEKLEAPPARKHAKPSIVLKLNVPNITAATDMDESASKLKQVVSMRGKSEDKPAAKLGHAPGAHAKESGMQDESERKLASKGVAPVKADEEGIIMHPEPELEAVVANHGVEIEYLHKIIHEMQQKMTAIDDKTGHHPYISFTAARRDEDKDKDDYKKTITFPQFQRVDNIVRRHDRRLYALETGQQLPEPTVRMLCASCGCEKQKAADVKKG